MKQLILFPVLLVLLGTAPVVHGASYAVARIPTPVFSTPDIAALFGNNAEHSLRLDRCGQLRELEFVALPGTVFTIEETKDKGAYRVFRVATSDYPYPTTTGYYIDSRLVLVTEEKPPERPRVLPAKDAIIASMLGAVGSRYVWGGNVRAGIPDLLALYPPQDGAGDPVAWQLRGVDCSGLLYEATGGFTPRNTSALVTYGKGIPVAGLSAKAIVHKMEPLDLIVWKGHVMIVLDRARVIESRLVCGDARGVVVSSLEESLARLMKKRAPADDYSGGAGGGQERFVVRRWYPAQ